MLIPFRTNPSFINEESWWTLACKDPIGAMQSPEFDLHTLAAPERWLDLQNCCSYQWVQDSLLRLSSIDYQRLWVDVLARVLPAFEQYRPNDIRPRTLVEARRTYCETRNEASSRAVRLASDQVKNCIFEIDIHYTYDQRSAEEELFFIHDDYLFSHQYRGYYAALACCEDGLPAAIAASVAVYGRAKESTWIWHRMLSYLFPETEREAQ